MAVSASAEFGPTKGEDTTMPDATATRLTTFCRADRRDDACMPLRLVVVVPDGVALLLINACADVATSAQAAACSKRCAFVIMILYTMNYGRDRLAAANTNERVQQTPWSTDVVILTVF